jgi:hypothetical protein
MDRDQASAGSDVPVVLQHRVLRLLTELQCDAARWVKVDAIRHHLGADVNALRDALAFLAFDGRLSVQGDLVSAFAAERGGRHRS